MGRGWPATSPTRALRWSPQPAQPAGSRSWGKSDTVDAEAAARAALNGEASVVPKAQRAVVESIRVLRVAFTSARDSRTRVALKMRDLIVTAPDCLREVLEPLNTDERATRCARFHVAGDLADPLVGTKLALRTLARRYEALSTEMAELEARLDELTARANPALRGANGVGPDVAAILLTAVGDNPERLRSEAAFGCLVCHLANRGILGQDGAPPSEPLGQPPGQPGPVADRDGAAQYRRPGDQGLCRASQG
jgi:hypothetical protein